MLKIDLKTALCSQKLTLGEEETADSSCDLPTFPFITTLQEAAAVGSLLLRVQDHTTQ